MSKASRVISALKWHLWQKRWLTWQADRRRRAEIRRRYPLVQGLGKTGAGGGKALLCYIAEPFLEGFTEEIGRTHTNYWKSTAIADCLADSGFTVDVTDWRNTHAPSARTYDLVVGQGRAFLASVRNAGKDMPKVYLGTGDLAGSTREAIARQCQLVRQRRGFDIQQSHPEDLGPMSATDIVYVGNEHTRTTYANVCDAELFGIFNPVVAGVSDSIAQKNFSSARHRFLWMAAYGTMRRGLDVLLEVFAEHPDYELWICGEITHEKSFFSHYHRELHELRNIKYIGWVDVAGNAYQRVTQNCGYILYPSVSDGMPGSVVNAMASGLVPIVTEAAGMECGGHGMLIPEIDHDVILRLIRQAARVDPTDLEQQSRNVAAFTSEHYSEYAFRNQFSAALAQIIERHGIKNVVQQSSRGSL